MAKTQAERQREYRERKKAELGDEWRKKETERVKKYFTPTSSLTRKAKKERRERNKRNVRKYRNKVKAILAEMNEVDGPQPGGSEIITGGNSDENGVSSTSQAPLIVKLPMTSQGSLGKTRTRKRVSRAVSKANRKVKSLTNENINLKRSIKRVQKRVERLRKRRHMASNSASPSKEVDLEMRHAGISPVKSPQLRKKLLLGACLSKEIAAAKTSNSSKTRNLIARVASGKIIKKYRLTSALAKVSTISRKRLMGCRSKDMNLKRRCNLVTKRLQNMVISFLEREDNSRLMPGKADAVKGEVKGQKIQKYVLCDYLRNLHLKFQAENPAVKMSLASFCRMRPKHVALVNFAARVTCLCIKHQNFALKLKTLKTLNLTNITSPDKFVETHRDQGIAAMLGDIEVADDPVTFMEWRRVTTEDGKQRMKVVNVQLTKADFVTKMNEQFADVTEHISRVKNQYAAFKDMKSNLGPRHVLVQMDFAENYSCQSMDEIQSAYWNQEMVTLHPAVIYFRDAAGEVQHRSTVYVSAVLHHNFPMVFAILKRMIVDVKTICPDVEHIHYWTDSPTSQYRNRSAFDIIARHQSLFGCRGSWQYFESGHGKGACDGIGGSAKRMADNAVKTQKSNIQSAFEFYQWASSTSSQISYFYIEKDEFDQAAAEVQTRQKLVNPVKGTMKLHSISNVPGAPEGQMMSRVMTCTCPECFDVSGFKVGQMCSWNIQNITKVMKKANTQEDDEAHPTPETTTPETPNPDAPNPDARNPDAPNPDAPTPDTSTPDTSTPDTSTPDTSTPDTPLPEEESAIAETDRPSQDTPVNVDAFVCALYDGTPYIGKVLGIDDEDNEVHITFMEKTSKATFGYKWPKHSDEIWVDRASILYILEEDPIPTGKSRRMFKLCQNDVDAVNQCMQRK